MSVQTFLATTGHGLARAERRGSDEWSVEALLTYQDVRCLTADPPHPPRTTRMTQDISGWIKQEAGWTLVQV